MMNHPSGASAKAPSTFEAGAREMNEAVKSRAPEAFFANAEDPLHNAFKAKAAIHSGPGGMPLLGEDARKRLLELADTPRTAKSLAYIHVPFCETRCLYCMFYQNPFKEEAVHEYAKKLVREIEMWSDKASQNAYPVHAVYFGGGTPTAFSPDDLRLVLGALKKYLPLANDCEITLEGRIHNFGDAKMEAALEGGVNRFSLGVQTFNSKVRQSVQRVDDRETILKRLDKLCSYDNAAVVLDLIYGVPGQTMEVWNDDLKTAASLPLDGIDCYQLNVFEKSPLARYIANGKLPAAADQAQKADMFARSVEYLTGENWRRLSNNHWANNTRERNIYNALGKSACDCLAFGCGCGAGGRLFGNAFMMERKLADYYAILEKGEKPAAFLMAPKPNWHLLRTISADMESGSISLAKISRAFGNVDLEGMAAPILKQWTEAGLFVKKGEWYYQTVAGQYWHVTLAAMISRIPSGVRDMARMMPRPMLISALKDMPQEKLDHMGTGVKREDVLRILEDLKPAEVDALLKDPMGFAKTRALAKHPGAPAHLA